MSFYDNLFKAIKGPVGNNMDNKPEDIIATKENFAKEGRYDEKIENGYIDRKLDTAIKSFQKDNDLKQDGYMNPGGETENKLKSRLEENKQLVISKKKPTLSLEQRKQAILQNQEKNFKIVSSDDAEDTTPRTRMMCPK